MELWDYAAICVIVFLSTIPGLIFICRARNVKNTRDFLSSSSEGLRHSPIALSLAATAIAGGTFIAQPSEFYRHGIVPLGLTFGYAFAVLVQTYMYLPVFFNTDKVSIYEYLERRYSRNARLIVSGIATFNMILTISVIVYIPAICLSQASGINVWYSVLVISGICILYTSFGGFKAVVWSDALQLLIMVSVFLAILIQGIIDQGSVQHIWKTNEAANRTKLFRTTQGPAFLTILLGTFFGHLASSNNQIYVQRHWASGNVLQARRSACFGYGAVFIFKIMVAVVGLTMFSKFHDCDPFTSGKIKTHDQELMLFVAEIFHNAKGIVGIFFAGLLCSSISSTSSFLNSGVCFLMEDFLKPWSSAWSESKTLAISKIVGVCYGCLSLSFILVLQNIPGIISAIYIMFGLLGGPVLGIFTLGMMSPWTNTIPAFIGCFTAMAFIGWASIGRMIAKPIMMTVPPSISGCNATGWRVISNLSSNTSVFNYTMSALNNTSQLPDTREIFSLYTYHPYWYPCWSTLMSIVVGLIATILLGGQNPEKVDPKLLFSFVMRTIHLLPTSIIKHLGFKSVNIHVLPEPKKIDKLEVLVSPDNELRIPTIAQHEEKKTDKYNVAEIGI